MIEFIRGAWDGGATLLDASAPPVWPLGADLGEFHSQPGSWPRGQAPELPVSE